MPIPLLRYRFEANALDADDARKSLMEAIHEEVKLKGQPHPRAILLGDGYLEQLDFSTMVQKQPEADAGATFQALGTRPGIRRRFALIRMSANDPDGVVKDFALLFEELDGPNARRRWWCATLGYTTDPATVLGRPDATWQIAGETDDPEHLFPFLRALAFPPPGAKPAEVLAPREEQPDIQLTFDTLPEGTPAPANARQMTEFAAALAVPALLGGTARGRLVLRIAGRDWELWILGDRQRADLNSMICAIANRRQPPADAVALIHIAIQPEDDPPVPGVQVVAEMDGAYFETWTELQFPDGPAGDKVLGAAKGRGGPVPEPRWLGVEPEIDVELTVGFEA